MTFDIQAHVVFDRSGRAFCPSCERQKGRRPGQKSLALLPSGAYKCHAGCTSEQVREALGQPKGMRMDPYRPVEILALVDLEVRTQALLTSQDPNGVEARNWLQQRGFTQEMIRHFHLGLVGEAISIPIPIDESGSGYVLKSRISPWTGNKAWVQKGIPAMVFFTYNPEGATQTWLCEGEWDAMMLGWAVRQAGIRDTAVATFTCGCSGIPKSDQLERLPGEIFIFYDRDEPGRQGAERVAQKLGCDKSPLARTRARVADVPAAGDPPPGWDMSDALNHGVTVADILLAADQAQSRTEPSDYERAMHEVERILAIEDPGRRLWELAAFSKQTPFTHPLLQKIFTERQRTATRFAPMDIQEVIRQEQPQRQWLIGSHISLGIVVLLYADGGVGKSLLAYSLTKSVALGIPWNGFPVQAARVLIIQTDEPDIDTCERLRIARFEEIGRDRVFIERNWQFSGMQQMKAWVDSYQPRLIVIDSLTSCNRFSEMEEKDMTYALGLLDLGQLASQFQCSVLILHHENKLGGVRGTTAIRNSVSEVWHLRKGDAKENLPPLQRVLDIEKSRSGCNSVSVVELDPEDNSWIHHGELTEPGNGTQPLSTRLLKYLNERRGLWFEPDELTQEFAHTSRDQIRKALERWRRQGVLEGEDRVKPVAHTKVRFKVYRAPLLSHSNPLSGDLNPSPDKPLESLDRDPTPQGVSSDLNPLPSQDPESMDIPKTRDTPRRTLSPQQAAQGQRIQVGDLCRYCGPPGSMSVTCAGKDLEVLHIQGQVATVKAQKWIHSHVIELRHLRKKG